MLSTPLRSLCTRFRFRTSGLLPTTAKLPLLLLGLSCAAPLAAEEEANPLLLMPLDQLLEIPVSSIATELPLPVDKNPGFVSVMKRDTMRKRGARNVQEALELFPGVEVTRSHTNVPKVSFSGKGSYRTSYLVQINGMDIRTLAFNDAPMHLFMPVDILESVDVIRGPGAVTHGENAMYGVVDIRLKKFENSTFAEVAPEERRITAGAVFSDSFADGDWHLHGAVHGSYQEGVEDEIDATILDVFAGGVYRGLDAPPYELNNAVEHAGLGLQLESEFTEISLYLYHLSRGDAYGIFGNPNGDDSPLITNNNFNGKVAHKIPLNEQLLLELALEYHWADIRIDNHQVFPAGLLTGLPLSPELPPYPGNPSPLTLYGQVEEYRVLPYAQLFQTLSPTHEIRYKIEVGHSNLHNSNSRVNYDPSTLIQVEEVNRSGQDALIPTHERNQLALTIDSSQQITPSDMIFLGLRSDSYDDLDTTVLSPRIAWLHDISDEWMFKTQYAGAHQTPSSDTLNARYRPIGNPDLKPEHSHTFEAGLIFNNDEQSMFRLTAQHSRIYDLILPVQDPELDFITRYNNPGSLISNSVTAEWNQRFTPTNVLLASVTYNHLDDDVDNAGDPSYYLPWFAKAALIHSFTPNATGTLQARYQDTYKTIGAAFPESVPARVEVDLIAELEPGEQQGFSFLAGIRNVFDEQITHPVRFFPEGINMGGRVWHLGMKYTW